MATYLYRIGKFAYRRKGAVLSVWLIILVLMGVGAATLSGPTKDSFNIPGTPAQQAQDLMAERFPDAPNAMESLSARFVLQAPAGTTLADPANVKAMDDMLDQIRKIDTVADAAKVDPATATPEQAAKALVNPVAANDSMTAMFQEKATAAGTSEARQVPTPPHCLRSARTARSDTSRCPLSVLSRMPMRRCVIRSMPRLMWRGLKDSTFRSVVLRPRKRRCPVGSPS